MGLCSSHACVEFSSINILGKKIFIDCCRGRYDKYPLVIAILFIFYSRVRYINTKLLTTHFILAHLICWACYLLPDVHMTVFAYIFVFSRFSAGDFFSQNWHFEFKRKNTKHNFFVLQSTYLYFISNEDHTFEKKNVSYLPVTSTLK